MKRITALLLAAMMMCAACCAQADTLDLLKPFWLRALEDANKKKAAGAADTDETEIVEIAEPQVSVADERFEVLRSAVYMNDRYGCEAHVYAEMVNTSEETISLDGVMIKVYDANDRVVATEDYTSYAPQVVVPGGALYMKEWLYDFVSSLDKAVRIELIIEESEYGYENCDAFGTASAYTDGEYLYVEVRNDTQEPAFEICALGVLQDAEGRILDILMENTYGNVGVASGNALLFKTRMQDHAAEAQDAQALGTGYILSY